MAGAAAGRAASDPSVRLAGAGPTAAACLPMTGPADRVTDWADGTGSTAGSRHWLRADHTYTGPQLQTGTDGGGVSNEVDGVNGERAELRGRQWQIGEDESRLGRREQTGKTGAHGEVDDRWGSGADEVADTDQSRSLGILPVCVFPEWTATGPRQGRTAL